MATGFSGLLIRGSQVRILPGALEKVAVLQVNSKVDQQVSGLAGLFCTRYYTNVGKIVLLLALRYVFTCVP